MDSKCSIVEFLRDSNSSCGYCKSANSHHNTGMWAYTMKVEDYQDLIDRGWRRSGQYCYKPVQTSTCCPLYTIRCEALNLKLSKSQKKLLKKVGKYISEGVISKNKHAEDADSDSSGEMEHTSCEIFNKNISEVMEQKSNQKLEGLMEVDLSAVGDKVLNDAGEKSIPDGYKQNEIQKPTQSVLKTSENEQTSEDSGKKCHSIPKTGIFHLMGGTDIPGIARALSEVKRIHQEGLGWKDFFEISGVGRDPLKPQCKKAKLLRLERKQKKVLEKGLSLDTVSKKELSSEKSLEDFINECSTEKAVNKLELRLVRAFPRSREFEETYKEEHSLYQKYQMAVHKDPISKVTEQQFTRFLITTPLKMRLLPSNSKEELIKESWKLFRKYQMVVHKETEDECNYSTFHSFLVATPLKVQKEVRGSSSPVQTGYGSFHQQYWLNGKLIAVGVIDILPKCVSSVYFFYDPDYSFLSLGTYGSLREIELVRSLHKQSPELCYYYMGYYIHSCPKMRYKARYTPSSLLCPEVYTWHPIVECQKKLDTAKYFRFNDDLDAICEDSFVSINKVLILDNHVAMSYAAYRQRVFGTTDSEEIEQYAKLVGRKCAERMLLYR